MARRIALAAAVLFCVWASSATSPRESAGITVSPERVQIGLFYGGQQISVRAAVPDGGAVAVRILGSTRELVLKKKGKKGGLLWMNVGEVAYSDVPSLLIVRSSQPLQSLGSVKALRDLGLDYEALESQAVAPNDQEARCLFGEMVKLKEREGLFSIKKGGIQFSPLGQGLQEASATFFLPPKAPPGEYSVDLFAFKNGQGTLLGSGSFALEFSPATAFVSDMARERGLLYGCMAAVIAILAGLATGFVFGGKGEAH